MTSWFQLFIISNVKQGMKHKTLKFALFGVTFAGLSTSFVIANHYANKWDHKLLIEKNERENARRYYLFRTLEYDRYSAKPKDVDPLAVHYEI